MLLRRTCSKHERVAWWTGRDLEIHRSRHEWRSVGVGLACCPQPYRCSLEANLLDKGLAQVRGVGPSSGGHSGIALNRLKSSSSIQRAT